MTALRVSVVVPTLNEATTIAECIEALGTGIHEVVIADGGSVDGTDLVARRLGARVVCSNRGRAVQMNAGAQVCTGDVLLFVHADTRLPEHALLAIDTALQSRQWGRFDVWLDSARPMIRLVGFMMNLRSRWSGIATGDQAIFIGRAAWAASGGYAPIALMEDIELSRRLKRLCGSPACLSERVRVSARRWEKHGVWRTIFKMWWLRLRYFLGASPERLHRSYYGLSVQETSRVRSRS